jgi:hypothetical protein
MDRRLFRNLRVKAAATVVAALATLGFFGLMRAQTPTRAGAPQTATPATSEPIPVATPPVPDLQPPATVAPSGGAPAGSSAPQVPAAPAQRPRPITRSRAS